MTKIVNDKGPMRMPIKEWATRYGVQRSNPIDPLALLRDAALAKIAQALELPDAALERPVRDALGDVVIRIPGHPQGKGRARSYIVKHGRKAGTIGHITPQQTRTYESLIQGLAMDAMGQRDPFICPVTLDMCALFAVPDTWAVWKREMALRGEIAPTGKPDLDNIKKAVKDGLNGVVWKDDSYVTFGTECKQYAEVPAVIIKIRSTGQYPAQIKHRPTRGIDA